MTNIQLHIISLVIELQSKFYMWLREHLFEKQFILFTSLCERPFYSPIWYPYRALWAQTNYFVTYLKNKLLLYIRIFPAPPPRPTLSRRPYSIPSRSKMVGPKYGRILIWDNWKLYLPYARTSALPGTTVFNKSLNCNSSGLPHVTIHYILPKTTAK